jgi:hypothetical protein
VALVAGAATALLGSFFADGGRAQDAKQFAQSYQAFLDNLDQRVLSLNQKAVMGRRVLEALTPRLSSNFDAHITTGIDRDADDRTVIELDRRRAMMAALLVRMSDEDKVEAGRNIQAADAHELAMSLARRLTPDQIRAQGSSVLSLMDNLRDRSFASKDMVDREIAREERKLAASLSRTTLKPYEATVANWYGIGKLRLARSVLSRGAAHSDVRRLINEAKSARYWADGAVTGVVERLESGSPSVTFSTDPKLVAGTIWSTIVMDNSDDLGNWGLSALSLTFDDAPVAPINSGVAEIQPPELPGDGTVDQNVVEAMLYLRATAFFKEDSDILSGKAFDLGTLFWFKDHVKPRGPWDYKTSGSEYEYAGNFNYGATGAALGLSLESLLRAAGYAQVYLTGTSRPEWGTPYDGGRPFGDDPGDQQAIEDGFQYYLQHLDRWMPYRTP